jgi:hypothetical protein
MADGVKKTPASEALLNGLHSLLADHFINLLQTGEDIPPSVLNAMRQFLRDNSIEAAMDTSAIPQLQSLKDLPTFDQERDIG